MDNSILFEKLALIRRSRGMEKYRRSPKEKDALQVEIDAFYKAKTIDSR